MKLIDVVCGVVLNKMKNSHNTRKDLNNKWEFQLTSKKVFKTR